MADVVPFRALRYDIAKVGDLSEVVTPPYDVIDPRLQQRLHDANPHNFIRLELGRDEPGDDQTRNKYTRAAELLDQWRRQGVLVPDSRPALYLHTQTFRTEYGEHTRAGFLARVRVEPFGTGRIFPHEQTLPGPKKDRLALYRATGCNLSPVFALYPDPENLVLRAVEAGLRDRTPLEAVDHLGVVHRLWPVHDEAAHTRVRGLMADKPLFIADGHHRYETSVAYREALRAEGADLDADPDHPANFALMMLVGMSDPGLLILPTHRLVSGLPGLRMERLAALLAPEFEVRPAQGPENAWDEVERNGDQDVLAFGTVADNQWCVARLRSDDTMDRLAPEHSADWRALGVSVLHVLVLKHLLAPEFPDTACRYVHTLREVRDDVDARASDLVALVPPATMEHVAAIASRLEKMPAKSTYFYPKLLSGLVVNPIR